MDLQQEKNRIKSSVGNPIVMYKSLFIQKNDTTLKKYSTNMYRYNASHIPFSPKTEQVVESETASSWHPLTENDLILREYDDIRPDEIVDITLDYVYCIGIYFLLAYILSVIVLTIFKSLTGSLKPKYTGVSK